MIAISISGFIIASITGAIFIGFSTADAGTNRLVVSHDLQLASTYFESDAQSADTTCRLPTGTDIPCVDGSTSTPASVLQECQQSGDSTPFLQFRWLERDQNPPTAVEVVDYVQNGTTIVREECKGSDFLAADLTLTKSSVVVHQLTGSVTLNCTYSPSTITGSAVSSDATCTKDAPTHPVSTVTVNLTSTATSQLGVHGSSGAGGFTDTVSYALFGARRSTE
jgi:hypothetical protein